MAKLIMLSGLPASGKSTKAKELLTTMGNAVRLNKDLLRTMLHFDKWTGKNESITRQAEIALAKEFLASNINVIVDDTNLGISARDSWSNLAKSMDAKFEHVKIDVDWKECVTRDFIRSLGSVEHSVGRDVITQMAMQHGLVEKPEKGYVICDIDGTLADITHRLHFVRPPKVNTVFGVPTDMNSLKTLVETKKDWKGFFGAIAQDKPREEVFEKISYLWSQGYTIVLVSARPETYRKETEKWLTQNGLSNAVYFTLIMRRANDKRPDTEVKQQILETFFKDKSLIYKVFDDRPAVIRMWREQGLTVEDVGHGVEF